jgi:hypothetical protein
VHRPVRGRCGAKGVVDLRSISDVDAARERAADLRRGLLERVGAAREQAERRAVAREAERDRFADPATGAGDDDVPTQERAR